MNIPRIRKATAAFVASLLTLPLGAWIIGEEPFAWSVLATALGAALVNAITVYMAPANTETAP